MSGTTNSSQIRSINIRENTAAGIDIAGNSNIISGVHAVRNDGNGISVVGDANAISTNQAFSNGDDGIDVAGDNNAVDTNSVGELGNGNGNAGIRVEGSDDPVLPIGQDFNNRLMDNRVYANGADGIVVLGGKSRITSDRVGEVGKGNGGNGIVVQGNANTITVNTIGDKAKGNGTPNPVELDSNIVKVGGLNGILIAAGAPGHELKKNRPDGSGDQRNGGCEFLVARGNLNATEKTPNETILPNPGGPPSPPRLL